MGKTRKNFSNNESNRKSTTSDVFEMVYFRSVWEVMSSFWSPKEPLGFSRGPFLLNYDPFWLKIIIFKYIFEFHHHKKIEKKSKFKNPKPTSSPDTTLFRICRAINAHDTPKKKPCVFCCFYESSAF